MAIVATQYDSNNKRALVSGQNEDGSAKGVVSASDTRLSVNNGGFIGEGIINGTGYTQPNINPTVTLDGLSVQINNRIRVVTSDGNNSYYSFEIAPQTITAPVSYDAVYTLYAFQNDVLVDGDIDSKVGLALFTADDLDNGLAIAKISVSGGAVQTWRVCSYTREIGKDFEINDVGVLGSLVDTTYIDGTGLSGERFIGEQMLMKSTTVPSYNGKYIYTGSTDEETSYNGWQKFQLGTDIVDTYGFYRKRWDSYTEYSEGDIVLVSGGAITSGRLRNSLMLCTQSHTATNTFPSSEDGLWTILTPETYAKATQYTSGFGLVMYFERIGNVCTYRFASTNTSAITVAYNGTFTEIVPEEFWPERTVSFPGWAGDTMFRTNISTAGIVTMRIGKTNLYTDGTYTSLPTGTYFYGSAAARLTSSLVWSSFTPTS